MHSVFIPIGLIFLFTWAQETDKRMHLRKEKCAFIKKKLYLLPQAVR